MIAREILIFLIAFAAGLLIFTFAGIVWMTVIWKRIADQYRRNRSHRALARHGVKIR